MSKVNVLGGDIPTENWDFDGSRLTRLFENIQLSGNIQTLEIQTEEKLKTLAGTAGWGSIGGVVGGLINPASALAGILTGALTGGNKTEICFACELIDGRRFLAITDIRTYQKILALGFNKPKVPVPPYEIPDELLEKFYEQVQGRFDPVITQLTFDHTASNVINIKIRNTKPFERKHQVKKIENAAKACDFDGQVTINVEKTWPKHSKDKPWSSSLICNGQNITVFDSGGCIIGLVASVIFLGVVVSYCSAYSSQSKRPATVETAPPPTPSREYLGTSPNGGYSLYIEGRCIIAKGVTDGDLRRLNVSLLEFKQIIKEETQSSCVLFE